MNVRRRILSATCAALAATFAVAAPAWASTMTIEIPNGAEISKPVNVTYAGVADAPGTTDITGTGPNMQLRTFLQRDGACQPTSAAQRVAPGSKFDGDTFVESPAPFSLTSTIVFEQAGTYRVCAYLEVGLSNDTQPPAAFAEAVLKVGAPPTPVHGAEGPRADARVGHEEAQGGRLHARQGLQAQAGLQEGEAHRALAERRAERGPGAELQGEPRAEGEAQEEVGGGWLRSSAGVGGVRGASPGKRSPGRAGSSSACVCVPIGLSFPGAAPRPPLSIRRSSVPLEGRCGRGGGAAVASGTGPRRSSDRWGSERRRQNARRCTGEASSGGTSRTRRGPTTAPPPGHDHAMPEEGLEPPTRGL